MEKTIKADVVLSDLCKCVDWDTSQKIKNEFLYRKNDLVGYLENTKNKNYKKLLEHLEVCFLFLVLSVVYRNLIFPLEGTSGLYSSLKVKQNDFNKIVIGNMHLGATEMQKIGQLTTRFNKLRVNYNVSMQALIAMNSFDFTKEIYRIYEGRDAEAVEI